MRSLMSTETRASSLFAAVAAAAGGAGPGGRHIVDSISCCMIIWCICAFCIISISYMSASTGTLTAIHATSCVVFMYYYNITFGFAYSAKFPQAQLQVKAGAQRSSEDYFCIKYNYNYYYFITQEKVPGVAKKLRKKIRLEWPSVLMVFNIKTVMQHNTIKSLHYNWIKLKKNLLLLFLISDYHHHYCDYGYCLTVKCVSDLCDCACSGCETVSLAGQEIAADPPEQPRQQQQQREDGDETSVDEAARTYDERR